jgi:hypothetical protein
VSIKIVTVMNEAKAFIFRNKELWKLSFYECGQAFFFFFFCSRIRLWQIFSFTHSVLISYNGAH